MKRVCALMMAVLFIVSLFPVAALAEGDFRVNWPSTKTYMQGDDFGDITATLDGNDATPFVTVSPKTLTEKGSSIPVTATYQNGEETYSDTTYVTVNDKGHYELAISNPPTKVTYAYNESVDPAGLTVDVTWDEWDGSAQQAQSEAGIAWNDSRLSISPTGFTKDQVGQTVPVYVTYTADGVKLTKSFDVDVTGIAADSISIDPSGDQTIKVEETLSLTAVLDPEEATDEVTWTSEDDGIASVSSDGLNATVTGVSEGGPVKITAKTAGGKEASISVTVEPKEEETPADFDIVASDTGEVLTGKTLTMKEGTERKLAVKSDVPIVAADVTWSVPDNGSQDVIDAAAFNTDGTVVARYRPTYSTGTVDAKVTVGGTTKTVTIKVEAATTNPKKYTQIKIKGSFRTSYMVGETFDPSGIEIRAFVEGEPDDGALGDKITSFCEYSIDHTAKVDPKPTLPTVWPEKFTEAGTATLTVYYTFTYTSGGTTVTKTLTATKSITVASERPFMVVVDETPYTSTYFEGEKLDTRGLQLKVAYTKATYDPADPGTDPDTGKQCLITRYEALPIDTTTIPDLNQKFNSDDVAAGYKQYQIVYPGKSAFTVLGTTLQVTVSGTVSISGISPEKLTFDFEDIEARTEKTFTVTVPVPVSEDLLESALAWSISNSKIVSYTKEFDKATGTFTVKVTALQPGSTTISVRPRGDAEETGVSCVIVVNGKPDETIYSMKLNHKKLTLLLGETGALIPEFVPENGYDDVTWSAAASGSYDPFDYIDQTKFEQDGLLKGIKIMPADMTLTITATTVHNHPTDADAPLTASAEVIITGIAVDSMTIDISSMTLYAGSTGEIIAVVAPEEATDKTIAWTSSDYTSAYGLKDPDTGTWSTISALPIVSIVPVYQEGSRSTGRVVTDKKIFDAYCAQTGKDTYTATVYAVASSGITKSCKVTVRKSVLIDTITLNKHSLVMSIGEEATLSASILPSNATNKTLKWTSSEPSVATVDEAGVVTVKGPGKTIITCEATDGSGRYDTCAIQVATVLIQSITVDPYTVSINEGDTAQLTARLYPANVTSTKVTWSSSNTDVATVDANGKVTGQGGGEAIIRATSADGGSVYGTAIVKVRAAVNVTSVKINPGNFELLLNDSTTLSVSASPKGAEEMTRTWSTSDKSIVSVDAKGKVTGLKLGTAKITVKVGKKTDTITIHVVSALSRYGEVVNCKKRVNVREGASGTSKTIGYAYLGDDYKVLGQTGNWVKIQFTSKKAGYIWYTYIDIVGGGNQYVSNGTNTNAGTAGTTNTTYTQVTIVNVKEWCNVRSGPGTGFSKVGTAPLHSVYTYRGVQGDWIQVLYGNTTAFIYKDYCQLS